MSCGVGLRCGSDPELLWLWCRLVAAAPIRPLAWEAPYAARVAQEIEKRQKKKYFLAGLLSGTRENRYDAPGTEGNECTSHQSLLPVTIG